MAMELSWCMKGSEDSTVCIIVARGYFTVIRHSLPPLPHNRRPKDQHLFFVIANVRQGNQLFDPPPLALQRKLGTDQLGGGGVGSKPFWNNRSTRRGGGGSNPMHRSGTLWNSTGVDPEQYSVFSELPRTPRTVQRRVPHNFCSKKFHCSLLSICIHVI